MDRSTGYTFRSHVFTAPQIPAGLYLVSTPIGNLADMTIRGLETLAGCTVIACEDTRTSGVLLQRYGIDKPKVSYTEHNADKRGKDLLRQIQEGASVALISDAGTPLVSDPGYRLVQGAVDLGLDVFPIPGASAPLAALVGSGLGNEDFRFCGFLPPKAQARGQRLQALSKAESTLIFFESPARLKNSLVAMVEAFGPERKGVVARELTKLHESFYRGTLLHLSQELGELEKIRGEIVVLVSGADRQTFSFDDAAALLDEALQSMKTKQAAAWVAEKTGLSKQALYKQALALKEEKSDGSST